MSFPSYRRSALTGFIAVPVFIGGADAIGASGLGMPIQLAWSVLAFFGPILYATTDFEYLKRTGGWFKVRVHPDDFKYFYVPGWKRITLYMLSAAAGVLVLMALGIEI